MFRHHSSCHVRGGFAQSVRSAVLIDNDCETKTFCPYQQHALNSFKFANSYFTEKCVQQQKKQIERRNLFYELPMFSTIF